MNTNLFPLRGFLGLTVLAAAAVLGCETEPPERSDPPKESAKGPDKPAEKKKVLVGKNVFLEIEGKKRRVVVSAEVVLRKGPLEQLMCRKNTKEHEAILAADADARDIHKALVLAEAEPGSPVKYDPKYTPATGQTIKITLQYEDKGKVVTASGRSWVRYIKTGKELDVDWVFAGSRLVENPLDKDKPPFYLANSGDVICVSNFESAMLDLPINSPKDNADLAFEAFTERIPPVETKVAVILEPVPDPKKKDK
jgi:hypothetical protein